MTVSNNRQDHKALREFVNRAQASKVYNFLSRISEITYPASCVFCGAAGESGQDLCAACYADLPWNTAACRQCALPLVTTESDSICGACLSDSPPFDTSYAPLLYAQQSSWLIGGLKFHHQTHHVRLLGRLLSEYLIRTKAERPQRIIPVPLHRTRLVERGYNQAVEIARPVARTLGLSLDLNSVHRRQATAAQSTLKLKDRQRNIRGAFVVSGKFKGEHIAILDDVVTSTATAREMARVLIKAGAGSISVWCVARAPAPGTHQPSGLPLDAGML